MPIDDSEHRKRGQFDAPRDSGRIERQRVLERRVDAEIDRIRSDESLAKGKGDRAEDHLAHIERIEGQDPLADSFGFDPERVRKMEDLEARTNPRGAVRRSLLDRGPETLDAETEREVRRAADRRERDRR